MPPKIRLFSEAKVRGSKIPYFLRPLTTAKNKTLFLTVKVRPLKMVRSVVVLLYTRIYFLSGPNTSLESLGQKKVTHVRL